jgi:formylmethanofuran dehydrogenase subunit B
MTEATSQAPRERFSDVTCTACGLMCDDRVLEVEGGRIDASTVGCPLARNILEAWGESRLEFGSQPDARVRGQPAGFDAAIDRAAAMLAEARAPLIVGGDRASIEAQRAGDWATYGDEIKQPGATLERMRGQQGAGRSR